MTETPDRRRVSEIARSLNQYEWRPTADEIECGAEFFQLVKGMEEAERSEFPRDASARPWPLRLRTESVVVLAEEVALLREEFLPGWRTRLPDGSPMAELIDLYVWGAQPVLRHVEAVRAAWALCRCRSRWRGRGAGLASAWYGTSPRPERGGR